MNITATTKDFVPGQRVQAHPATDRFMRGVRFGDVVAIGRLMVTVKFDGLPHRVRVHPANILDAGS